MAAITIFVRSNRIADYEFGYSETDDIAMVMNWQTGNNIFLAIDDGNYYVFARLIGSASFIRHIVTVNCDGCTVAATGFYDITPSGCRVAATGYFDTTEAVNVNTGTLIIGIDN
jgi:hypothetical protein